MQHTRALVAAIPAALLAVTVGAAHAQVRLGKQATAFTGLPATTVAQPPGESRRLYEAVRAGSVRALRDGALLPTPVLTLSGVDTGGEGGLLGLAFSPDFQNNGFMFVYYSVAGSPSPGDRLVRYTLDPANPEAVIPGSAITILTVARGSGIHHGGWIGFGPAGLLYLSVGNAGNSANSQPLNTRLGKVLRLDVDRDDFPDDPANNYAIPADNPFAASGTALPEIWAYGLRNPWRCSIDALTGDLWIGDVGDSTREEIDFQPAGPPPYAARNYGYPCMEGTLCRNATGCASCTSGAFTLPIYDYPRTDGFAVMCGAVYRGRAIPALRGVFLFGDYSGKSYAFRPTPTGISEFRVLTAELNTGPIIGWGEDNASEQYICASTGAVYRVIPQCPANCDGSTAAPALNVADFTCFLLAYAAGDAYANCDGSTTPPALNVADFSCFLQLYANGCP
jgi:glucose/arabinose dehydrogenase